MKDFEKYLKVYGEGRKLAKETGQPIFSASQVHQLDVELERSMVGHSARSSPYHPVVNAILAYSPIDDKEMERKLNELLHPVVASAIIHHSMAHPTRSEIRLKKGDFQFTCTMPELYRFLMYGHPHYDPDSNNPIVLDEGLDPWKKIFPEMFKSPFKVNPGWCREADLEYFKAKVYAGLGVTPRDYQMAMYNNPAEKKPLTKGRAAEKSTALARVRGTGAQHLVHDDLVSTEPILQRKGMRCPLCKQMKPFDGFTFSEKYLVCGDCAQFFKGPGMRVENAPTEVPLTEMKTRDVYERAIINPKVMEQLHEQITGPSIREQAKKFDDGREFILQKMREQRFLAKSPQFSAEFHGVWSVACWVCGEHHHPDGLVGGYCRKCYDEALHGLGTKFYEGSADEPRSDGVKPDGTWFDEYSPMTAEDLNEALETIEKQSFPEPKVWVSSTPLSADSSFTKAWKDREERLRPATKHTWAAKREEELRKAQEDPKTLELDLDYPEGTIAFHSEDVEIIRIDANGDFYSKGDLVDNDEEIFQHVRDFFSGEHRKNNPFPVGVFRWFIAGAENDDPSVARGRIWKTRVTDSMDFDTGRQWSITDIIMEMDNGHREEVGPKDVFITKEEANAACDELKKTLLP